MEDPTQQPKDELILFRFMAPERFSATIELTGSTQQQTIVKSGTTNNVITYMYDVIDSTSSQSVGSTANVSYKIQNGGNTQTLYVTTAAKTDTALLLDSYLKSGMNRIQITVTDQATNAQATMSLTYYVIDMDVSSQFDNLQPVTADIM